MSGGIDCSKVDPSLVIYCREIRDKVNESENKIEDIQTQIWILSGVAGGVALILIIVAIALAIQLSSLRQKVFNALGNSNPKPKPMPEGNMTTRSAQNPAAGVNRQPPAHSFVQPPRNNVTSEEELAQLGFSAYTGHPIDTSRGMPNSPGVSSAAGGVRVLPRNPPTGFRQNGAYNNGYM